MFIPREREPLATGRLPPLKRPLPPGRRVCLHTLKIGDRFASVYDGEIYVITRWYKDRAPPDISACPIVRLVHDGIETRERETMFAGTARGIAVK